MEEKYMVNDIINNVKQELLIYQDAISETENIKLRQELQKIRDNNEAFQFEIYKVAQVKGYYKEEEKAKEIQISKIKNELEG